jgi:uncharacterized membrane protein YbhN (UPF0104 family)
MANIASLFINGIFIKVILVPFNKSIAIFESLYVSLISSVGNYFAPVGAGLGFRAIYLKRRHGLAYGDFITTVAGNYLLVFLTTSAAGLIALAIVYQRTGQAYWVLTAVFTSLFIIDFMFMSVKVARFIANLLKRLRFAKFVADLFQRIIEGWLLVIGDKRLVTRLLGLTAIGFPLLLLTIFLVLSSLNIHVAFSSLLMLAALSSLSVFINITPGNIGVKEAVFIFSSQVIGLTTPQILAYSLIDRGVLFIVLSCGWIFIQTHRNLTSQLLKETEPNE